MPEKEAVYLQIEEHLAKHMRRQTTALIAVFLVVTIAFLGVAARVEHNTRLIHSGDVQARYNSCKSGEVILRQFNTTQKQLEQAELDSIRLVPDKDLNAIRARRAAIYRDSIVALPDCEKLVPEADHTWPPPPDKE